MLTVSATDNCFSMKYLFLSCPTPRLPGPYSFIESQSYSRPRFGDGLSMLMVLYLLEDALEFAVKLVWVSGFFPFLFSTWFPASLDKSRNTFYGNQLNSVFKIRKGRLLKTGTVFFYQLFKDLLPFFVLETGSQCIGQGGLTFTEIYQSLPTGCWD